MSRSVKVREGRLPIDPAQHEIYYQIHGDGPHTLLCLHGGPGANISYLQRLGELAGDGLQVVMFDQLGGGNSDRPDDDSLWRIERFVQEVDAVRQGLDLGNVHLLGRSWGAMLGLQYTLDYPDHVTSLIFSNAGASSAQMIRAITRARLELPDGILSRMLQFEAARDFDNPAYEELVWEFNARFLRRSAYSAELASAFHNQMATPFHRFWSPVKEGASRRS